MAKPNKLRGKDVLKVLADNGHSTTRAAVQLDVTPQAIRDWLRVNRCQRAFVCADAAQQPAQER